MGSRNGIKQSSSIGSDWETGSTPTGRLGVNRSRIWSKHETPENITMNRKEDNGSSVNWHESSESSTRWGTKALHSKNHEALSMNPFHTQTTLKAALVRCLMIDRL